MLSNYYPKNFLNKKQPLFYETSFAKTDRGFLNGFAKIDRDFPTENLKLYYPYIQGFYTSKSNSTLFENHFDKETYFTGAITSFDYENRSFEIIHFLYRKEKFSQITIYSLNKPLDICYSYNIWLHKNSKSNFNLNFIIDLCSYLNQTPIFSSFARNNSLHLYKKDTILQGQKYIDNFYEQTNYKPVTMNRNFLANRYPKSIPFYRHNYIAVKREFRDVFIHSLSPIISVGKANYDNSAVFEEFCNYLENFNVNIDSYISTNYPDAPYFKPSLIDFFIGVGPKPRYEYINIF